jgi:hypothetical protein
MYIERILQERWVSLGDNGVKVRPNSKILVNIVMTVHEKGMDGDQGKGNEEEILLCARHYELMERNG